jgi:hypothetical protein
MKNEPVFKTLPPLKTHLSQTILTTPDFNMPITFFYQNDYTSPKYKITVEVIEETSFLDSHGRKWVRADED